MSEAKSGASGARVVLITMRLMAVILFGLAGFAGFSAWDRLSNHNRLAWEAIPVEAQMTGAYDSRRGRRGPFLHPEVSYRTREGRQIVAFLVQDMGLAEIQRGRILPAGYDPAAPESVHSAYTLADGPGTTPRDLILLSLFFVATAVYFLVAVRKPPAPR